MGTSTVVHTYIYMKEVCAKKRFITIPPKDDIPMKTSFAGEKKI